MTLNNFDMCLILLSKETFKMNNIQYLKLDLYDKNNLQINYR